MDAVIQYLKDHTQVFGISRRLRVGDIEILEEILRYAPDLAVLGTVVDLDLSPLAPKAPLPVKLNLDSFRALKIITLSNLRVGSLDHLILPQLERLVANGNDIAVLPRRPAVIWPLLVKANLSCNKISSFAEVDKLADLSYLRELDLRNNPLVVDSEFARVTGQLLPQLRYLNCMIIGTTDSSLASARPRDVLDRSGELSARIDEIAAGNGGWSKLNDIRELTHGRGIPLKSADHDRAFRLHREMHRTIRARDAKCEQIKRAEDVEAAALDKYILMLTKFSQPPFSLRAVPLLSALVAYRSSGICEIDVGVLEKKLLIEVKRKVPMRFTEIADVMDELRAASSNVTRYEKKTAQLAERIQRLDDKLARTLRASPSPSSPILTPQKGLLSDYSSMPPPSVRCAHLLDSPPLAASMFPSPAMSSTCPPPQQLPSTMLAQRQRDAQKSSQCREKKTLSPDREATPYVSTQQRHQPENADFCQTQPPRPQSAIGMHVADAKQQANSAEKSIPFSAAGALGVSPQDAAVVNIPSSTGATSHSVPNSTNTTQHSTQEAEKNAKATMTPSHLNHWATSAPALQTEMDAPEMRSGVSPKPDISRRDDDMSSQQTRSPIKTRYARYKKTYGCHIAKDCVASPTPEAPHASTDVNTVYTAPSPAPTPAPASAPSPAPAPAPSPAPERGSAHACGRDVLLSVENLDSTSNPRSPTSEMAIEHAFLEPRGANVGARDARSGIPLAVARASQELNNTQARERARASKRVNKITHDSVPYDVPSGQVIDHIVQNVAIHDGGRESGPDSGPAHPARGWGSKISLPSSDTFTSDSGSPPLSPMDASRNYPPFVSEPIFHADFNTSPPAVTSAVQPIRSHLSSPDARPVSTSLKRYEHCATESPTPASLCYAPLFARPVHFEGKDADVVQSALASLRRDGYMVPSSVNKLKGDATLRQTFLFLCHRIARSAAENVPPLDTSLRNSPASPHKGRPMRRRNLERFDKWSVHGGILSPVAKIDFTRFKSNR